MYVAAALAAVAVLGSIGLAQSAEEPPRPPLAVTAFSVEVGEGSEVNASMSVTNNTSRPIEGRVGWLVSVPSGNSWDQRVYQSTTETVRLAQGESINLKWLEIAPVPAGSYRFEAWSHITDGNASRYSDTVELDEGDLQFAAATPLLRIEPHSDLVSIESVEIINDSPGKQFSALVALSNLTGLARQVEMRIELVDTSLDDPMWWKREPVDVVFHPVSASADGLQSIQIAEELALLPGEYAVRVSITDSGGQPQLDRVLVGSEVYVVPEVGEAMMRTALSSGSAAIDGVVVQDLWDAEVPPVAKVAVWNQSGEYVDRVVRGGWMDELG